MNIKYEYLNMSDEVFHIVFPTILGIGMILWIYCLWFAYKYDNSSKALIMLFFLNIYYVPFYMFRINRIKKENRIKRLSEEIYDSEFLELSRLGIIDSLKFWASKSRQIESQKSNEEENITNDLFQQWEDFYRIDNRIINEAFNKSEKELLESFDKSILISQEKFKNDYPKLTEFQKTNDWQILNRLAVEIIKEMK